MATLATGEDLAEAPSSLFGRVLKHRPNGKSCHGSGSEGPSGAPTIMIVGTPNVGKSVVFNRLTGAYVTVSNYPGTTVEISRGKGRIGGAEYEIVDTPGMYSFMPISEEERVARSMLLLQRPTAVLHVIDAKNLDRMLPMTIQLVEAELPVVLVLNMMDEAERLGIKIDTAKLSIELGIPVVATVATAGRGLDGLRGAISGRVCCSN